MLLKTSYQREIDRFCQKLISGDYQIREATKGALSQARAKLNPWAFQRLNEVAVKSFYDEAEYYVWHEHRLLAVDGSRLRLPKSGDIAQEFGEYGVGPKADSKVCMATCSLVYDVLNQVTISSGIGPWSKSEIAFVLEDHLSVFESGDVVLADRYYPSTKLMMILQQKGVEFCFRMKENWWLTVKEFTESEEIDQEVEFKVNQKILNEIGITNSKTSVQCRLIKIIDESGNIEILCTSLLDKDKYSQDEFGALYDARWGVEEEYKLLKSRIEVENFSGKTARSVYQDYYAKVFMMTLCATLSHPIADKVREEYHKEKTGNKYSQQINKTNALSVSLDYLVNLLLKPMTKFLWNTYDDLIYKARVIIKPFRKYARNKKPKKQYFTSYKGI